MSLVFFERLIDLADNGVLALTLGSLGSLPLPAERHGYARWHDAQGTAHDRLALCTRAAPTAVMGDAVKLQRAALAGAVPSVKGRIDWVAQQVQDGYREAPGTAAAIDERQVLLIFACPGTPQLLRVVDVPAGRVVVEESVHALCTRLDCQPMLPERPFEAVMFGAGGGWMALWLGRHLELLCLRDGRFERAAPPQAMARADRIALTHGTWFIKEYDTNAVRVLSAGDGAQRALLASAHERAGVIDLSGAASADRCLVSRPGGAVELIDENGRSLSLLRPFPSLSRKDVAGVALTASGQLAQCAALGREGVLVDLVQARQAAVEALPCDELSMDRSRFDATMIYRGAQVLTDRAWLRLQRAELTALPLEALDWTPALRPGARRSAASAAHLADDWAILRKPALALKPAARAKGLSRLYGCPHLANAADWPRYQGRPMLLMCQIELSGAASAMGGVLPAEGGLLFFVAVDDEGEVELDDLFNPVAWQVLWTPALAAQPLPPLEGAPTASEARVLRLVADATQWPQPDAPIVQAQGWDAQRLEAYRQFVDQQLPDGAAAGHRLGGYPSIVQHNDLEIDAAIDDGRGTQPAQWRLLLQLNSDDTVMWGTDSGLLYVLVHEQDLGARDFSRTVVLTQGR